MKRTLLAVMSALSLFGISYAKEASDFTLKDTDGNEVTLSTYKGKIVVLEWFNHGCPFVKKHYDKGHMQKLQETYTENDVVWLAICSSAPSKQGHRDAAGHKADAETKGTKATAILLDEDGKVGKLYSAKTTPHMFIIDAEGKIAYEGAIDSKRSTNPDHIADSTNFVKQALDELLAGKAVSKAKTTPYGCSVKY